MFSRRSKRPPEPVSGELYGVAITLGASDDEILALMLSSMPPEWHEGLPEAEAIRFTVTQRDGDEYELVRDQDEPYGGSRDRVIKEFDWILRNHVAASAESHVFVHAGTVAFENRAIIIPGPSFSGKTNLVRELVRHGAVYYSDEYAVLDETGLVHPYVKTVDVRVGDDGAKQRLSHDAAVPGSVAGTESLPVGLIVLTQYRAGGHWSPSELSPAQAVIETLPHVFSVHSRPEQVLLALRNAVQPATTVKSERGDASVLAGELLAMVKASGR